MGEIMKRWKVTVTLVSTPPNRGEGSPVEQVYLKAGDELDALTCVIQNMRTSDEWYRVDKIVIEPA